VWISKKRWKQMNNKIRNIENLLEKITQETDKKIYIMAKKILREPKKLSEDIDSIEDIERYVNDFINH